MGNVYEVYKNGELYFTGVAREVADKLNYARAAISTCANENRKVLGCYRIVKKNSEAKVFIKKKKVENEIDGMEWSLKYTGNTCSNKNPEQFIAELKERGIEFKYRKVINKQDGDYYVLERTN